MTLREGPFRAKPGKALKPSTLEEVPGWWIEEDPVDGFRFPSTFVPASKLPALRRLLEKLEGRAPVVKCDYGDKCPGHASPGDRPCGWAPAQPTKGEPKRKAPR